MGRLHPRAACDRGRQAARAALPEPPETALQQCIKFGRVQLAGRCLGPCWLPLSRRRRCRLPCAERRAAACVCRDYRPMEHLDRYEARGIDDAFIDDVTEEERFAARLAAERELAERDVVEGRLTGRRRGLPAALEGKPAGLCPGGAAVVRRAHRQAQGECMVAAACSHDPTLLPPLARSVCDTLCAARPLVPPAAEELDDDERRPRRRRRLEEAQAGMDEDEDLVRWEVTHGTVVWCSHACNAALMLLPVAAWQHWPLALCMSPSSSS